MDMPKNDEDWRAKLTPEQFEILRMKGTEPPFSGEYVDEKRAGVYTCGACGNELFSSETKYDSGSGWPSFYDLIDEGSVELREDASHGMVRTEAVCARCGGHLGHVFDDGPADKGGKRYCINSLALQLEPKEEKGT